MGVDALMGYCILPAHARFTEVAENIYKVVGNDPFTVTEVHKVHPGYSRHIRLLVDAGVLEVHRKSRSAKPGIYQFSDKAMTIFRGRGL